MMDEVEQRILKFVLEEYGGWSEDGVAYFKMQVDAYRALEAFCPPDIPPATLRGIKRRAAAVDGDDYNVYRESQCIECIEQQQRLAGRLLAGQIGCRRGGLWHDRRQRCSQAEQQADGAVIIRIQGKPGGEVGV